MAKLLITELRERRNMTQQELADVIGVRAQTVSAWERGISFPTWANIPKLEKEFKHTVDELFEEV